MTTLKRKSKNNDFINWRSSAARAIVIEDLVRGILPLENSQMTAEEAFEIYREMDEFAGVVFVQFRLRLKDHRSQVKKDLLRSRYEEECLRHDRRLFPRKSVDHNGTPVFDLHPAKLLLRQDVAEKKHLQMTPFQLWESRDEYLEFEQAFFRNKIYQAARRQKFINYLQMKREGKNDIYRCQTHVDDPVEAAKLLQSRRQSMSHKRNKDN
eukprot:scaffold16306_cov113-Cylindrotheca_fusiformis.AAC.1